MKPTFEQIIAAISAHHPHMVYEIVIESKSVRLLCRVSDGAAIEPAEDVWIKKNGSS